MWRDLRAYVRALANHWLGFVAGPVASLALLLWQQLANQEIPNWIFALVLAGGIPIAGFLAWRDAHRQIQKPNPGVARHIAHLIQLKESATNTILNASMAGQNPPDAKTWGEWYKKFMETLRQADLNWQQRVVAVLPQAGASPGEVSRFQVLGVFAPIPGLTEEHAHIKGMVAERIRRLDDLITILEQRNRVASS